MTFTRRKFNRKFRGGKKKTIRKKRKTRRKRRGGKSDAEMMACMKKNAHLGLIAKNKFCREGDMAKPVKSTLDCVDDDSAKYGNKGNNNCERLRGKVQWMNDPTNVARKAEAEAQIREICSRDAGKYCKKTCSSFGQPCPKPVVEAAPVVAPKSVTVAVSNPVPAVVETGPQRGTGECDQHNFYESGVFKKSEGKHCRKNRFCKLAKGKNKSSSMNTRKCLSRTGGRRKSKRRKSKRRKSRRKKRKTKKRRRRKRQRGGMGQYNCVYPSNVGEIFTGIKLNKNPVLPDPINTNGNTRTVQKLKQKGGGFLDNIGLGDGLLGWYKGTNAISNVPIRYKGGKALMEADPMHQPGLLNKMPVSKTANVPKFYSSASDKAVDPKFTIKIPEPTTTAA